MPASFFETEDGAKLYFEDRGKGDVILLVHGWMCSSKFWRANVPELAKEFRVVTIDLRGHGYSSKTLCGHTVRQYARDVRALIERLNLKDITLAGWSLGGVVVLSYFEQYAEDHRLKGLGLIDSTPAPFHPGEWNSHPLKTTQLEGAAAVNAMYIADRVKPATTFAHGMFKTGKAPEADAAWITAELLKTPTWIALAIYSDFCLGDYTWVLPNVSVPAIVYGADSKVFKKGVEQARWVAAQLPKGKFVPFEDGGHLLFYESPGKFNESLAEFVRGLK
ncbi:MAG TPA: alpha/beta hydrolase [Verrucomicrobiae bacterium]|nr:alpha/beta hydrolase [Verrucomicrobiae bacterium]